MERTIEEGPWRIYRGTSLIRNRLTLASYSRFVSRALWWSYRGGLLLMSEVPPVGYLGFSHLGTGPPGILTFNHTPSPQPPNP